MVGRSSRRRGGGRRGAGELALLVALVSGAKHKKVYTRDLCIHLKSDKRPGVVTGVGDSGPRVYFLVAQSAISPGSREARDACRASYEQPMWQEDSPVVVLMSTQISYPLPAGSTVYHSNGGLEQQSPSPAAALLPRFALVANSPTRFLS